MGAGVDVNLRLRRLPKVDEVLRGAAAMRLLERAPRWAVVDAVRMEIDALRSRLLSRGAAGEPALSDGADDGDAPEAGESIDDSGARDASPARDSSGGDASGIADDALRARVEDLLRPSLGRVLNGTGVVLHTNLGRAPLAAAAIARIEAVARGYSNLEYVVGERRRGSRHEHVSALLEKLTASETALVVNNGAAAVLLVASALAGSRVSGREVIVSRGELVEIGGSFRIPDVLRAAGARLVEVGTTNRTHLADYERAIGDDTALLLKVHPSNFAVVGFTAEVTVEALCQLGRERGLPVAVDLGSGSLLPTTSLGLPAEPTAQAVVAAGADVVTFSGDKLLGGPQAGILLARRAHHEALRRHPLMRALRPDKLTLAALEATLELYRDGRAAAEVPALAMLSATANVLFARAEALQKKIVERCPWLTATIVEASSAVGGGALPLSSPPSFAVAVTVAAEATGARALDADGIEARLRTADPPLVARIADGRLLVDVRTLRDDEIDSAAAAFLTTGPTPQSTPTPTPAAPGRKTGP